jgi:UDP-N-acetylglucosamine acyltransferase
MIHPTAIVEHPQYIHESAEVGPFCVVRGHVSIDAGAKICSHVSIGELPEHGSEKYELKARGRRGAICIGNRVVIREFTTVNAPMGGFTLIEDDAYIMAHSHISHDNVVGSKAIIATGVLLGGWTRVMAHAYMGLGCITHQYTTVGSYAIVAAGATLVKDLPPLAKYIPGKPLGINDVAIKRNGLPVFDPDLPLYRALRSQWEEVRHKERDWHEFDKRGVQ